MGRSNMWEIEVRHAGLNKYRKIRGRDKYEVEEKARVQQLAWDEMWERKLLAEQKALERERRALDKQEKIHLATERTNEALTAIERMEGILRQVVEADLVFDWEWLKDRSDYTAEKPNAPEFELISEESISEEPMETDPKYEPRLTLLDKIFPSRKEAAITAAKGRFEKDYELWETAKRKNAAKFKLNAQLQAVYEEKMNQWESNKREFLERQELHNSEVDKRRAEHLAGVPEAIVDYCESVLSASDYPDSFPQGFDIDYNAQTRTLIVDYDLPSIDDMPKLKAVKYVQTRDEFTESFLSASAANKLYDNLVYQIALRSVYEFYEADAVDSIHSIVFNGWVRSVDKSTGQEIHPCIISLQVGREEFSSINLANVDPKACFKSLKGVGSSKLYSLTSIPPLMNIDREDSRFVASYAVAGDLEDSTNLAAMDWEDFEHLIREVFEKEFSEAGGEVKITQASRDRGVDAVAFDPDPIRGGKIVIQAKRYTNTVSVSAVRDLYGTVMNEGATKGILVTTSDYGPDAYEFAKGKPLTLLNGGHLLHLLEKHGHKASIDIKAAKKILAEKDE